MNDQSKEQELVKIPRRPYPWLVICDGANIERQVFYSIAEKRFNLCFVSELQNKYITCCYQRWSVLMDYDNNDCSLLNLSTKEKLELPPLDVSYHHNCVLSSPPMEDGCRVLFICGQALWSCHVGDTEFLKHEWILDGDIAMAAVNFEGRLNILSFPDYNLRVAEFSDANLQFSTVIRGTNLNLIIPINDGAKNCLIESFGELFFVNMTRFGHEVLDVKIFRADFTKKEWVMIEYLGDRTFFFDEHKGFSSPASKLGLRGNCVYYVNDFDRNLYCFDLQRGRISMSLPCPTVTFESSMSWVSLPCDDQDE